MGSIASGGVFGGAVGCVKLLCRLCAVYSSLGNPGVLGPQIGYIPCRAGIKFSTSPWLNCGEGTLHGGGRVRVCVTQAQFVDVPGNVMIAWPVVQTGV